ncbi:MAG: polyphosphate kinase 1 [Alphaproteobacteria bacterium]|nr:polyphosphate kinase 1 [Alphaproteobacteria bacterium]
MTLREKNRSGANGGSHPCTPAVAIVVRETAPVAPPAASDGKSAPLRQRAKTTAKRPARPRRVAAAKVDLRSPDLYLNRELTWLNFNSRVLAEAQDERVPLLERVKFLSIANSNLDEFFMKRIGGLKQQIAVGVHQLTVDGRTPIQQTVDCVAAVRELQIQMREVYRQQLAHLKAEGIVISTYDQLTAEQRKDVREQYIANIFPLITPLAMDPAHPFPFISNLSLNLLVTLRYRDESEPVMNRIKVPLGSGVPRFLKVGADTIFVPLEDVMARNLDLLFPDMEIESCELFRVTRNANTELDEDQAEDLLSMIEAELRYRKFARFVRLEIGKDMDPTHRGMLAAELGLDDTADVFESDVLLGMRDLMQIAGLDLPHLHDPDHHPITNVRLHDERSVFHLIREAGSILLHHPYESFGTSVERFVREASRDPKVRAIKMTLYRTSEETAILEYLLEAARNGKQVAVAVELKARFDEAANIQWASRLEEAGIHVTYGVVGLKTHSKVILVVRSDYAGIRRYVHIGTGNYHAGTARLYSDLGLLTCDDDIGHDVTELFNYLTSGCKPSRKYRKLLTAPKMLKKALLAKIEREIEGHSDKSPGLIRFKTNALEDVDITEALYRASRAGVKVDLVVRDTCRLRPHLPGISDRVDVIGIVGRFLEHSRIYYFRNGGDEEYFIGSADLMTRNLESRVEIIAPVEDPALRADLHEMLEAQLADRRSAWEMQPDGSYVQRRPDKEDAQENSQDKLIALAEKRQTEAGRLRKRKPRAIARRSIR